MLKIPFLSDQCTEKIKQAAIKHKIPVQVVSIPGKKLKNLFTSAKPLDKPQCPNNNCRTCLALTSHGKCTDMNVVYHMSCDMTSCKPVKIGNYDGETLRPIDDRFLEHYRAANNPLADSYIDKPWSRHYAKYHPECDEPKISLAIVDRASTTNERKIKEARLVLKNQSDLNTKDEQTDLRRFLV